MAVGSEEAVCTQLLLGITDDRVKKVTIYDFFGTNLKSLQMHLAVGNYVSTAGE
jgi:hypothetical protein